MLCNCPIYCTCHLFLSQTVPEVQYWKNRGVIVDHKCILYSELFKTAVYGPVQTDLYKEVAVLLK